jgi:hypothetical protein
MSTTWVILAFGISGLLALLLLYFSGPKAWCWHVLAAAAGLAIGLMPRPGAISTTQWNSPASSLVIGPAVVFLMVWGVAAAFMGKRRRSA